ncbi:hypothetical protein ACFV0L_10355 [Streptosporangium canum]|uniref:hypothetical protein n=1 Tax=Streptosporangium canum TaxID=324952 RepID=UPI00369B0355
MSEQVIEPGTGETDPQVIDETHVHDAEELQKEVEKWRSLARKHETNWKAASKELGEYRTANLSDAEKAIEDAKAEGRRAALTETGSRVAKAELKAYAATSGVALPASVTDFLDTTRFVAEDGSPDMEAIAAFVDPFKSTPKKAPKFTQNIGAGPQGGGTGPTQLTREDLARMTPPEVNEARREGRLNQLMFGEP